MYYVWIRDRSLFSLGGGWAKRGGGIQILDKTFRGGHEILDKTFRGGHDILNNFSSGKIVAFLDSPASGRHIFSYLTSKNGAHAIHPCKKLYISLS